MSKVDQHMSFDHVGWITNDVFKFEAFWVGIIGFEKVAESQLKAELVKELFGLSSGARCIKYKRYDMVIEVHCFDKPVNEEDQPFEQFGINHMCLHVEDRDAFLKSHEFEAHIYDNPGGWKNIFIRDFEGNWVELKETFKE